MNSTYTYTFKPNTHTHNWIEGQAIQKRLVPLDNDDDTDDSDKLNVDGDDDGDIIDFWKTAFSTTYTSIPSYGKEMYTKCIYDMHEFHM